jgi:PAS domain S-box-containing protein
MLLFFLCLSGFCTVGAVADEETRLVVVLYPEASNGSPGGLLADQSIRATFATAGGQVEVHNEYLDLSRFPDERHQRDVAKFLRRKYAGQKVDLVLAGLASALDYAIQYRDDIFPHVPIIFLAVDQQEVRDRHLPADVIGVPAQFDLVDTLDTALRLHPETERVYVIAGKSKFDLAWQHKAQESLQGHESKVELTYLTGLPMDDLLERVGQLPDHSLILYLHVFEDGDGRVHIPANVLGQLAAVANAPIYGHVDTYIGRGIVGGRVFSFEEQGKQAATLGLRVLKGEKAEQIGIQPTSQNHYLFDWRQLSHWDIREASLPHGSIVRYRQLGLWDQYQWHLIGFVSFCLLQSALIVHIIAQRLRLAPAERRFRQAVNAAPTGMLMVNRQGTILLANRRMEQIFGYRIADMLGQSVEMLVPAGSREQHPNLRNSFFEAPEVRSMGADREIYGQRQDGSQFPVEIGLNPLQTDAGVVVLASVTDVTDRRRSEDDLRQKQAELQELTGKLLTAQETERRRIARDLHDDLGQSLALLSVEMDLLRQKPPETSEQLSALVEAMSDQVKQLSSSVHDLSHQLHPMKLEQLGLEAAVKGLCKELSVRHGLPIAFAYDSAPQAIPRETALCVYRIAQEALHNVVKHSRARHAAVEIRPRNGSICLRVQDDGKGFDPVTIVERGGLGLASMRERLRLVDGELTLESGDFCGTLIEARAPLCSNNPNHVLGFGQDL